MNTKDEEYANYFNGSEWRYDFSKSYQLSSYGRTMDAMDTATSSIANSIYDYADIYNINNILNQRATSPQQMREDTLTMLRQRTTRTLVPQRRQSEINIPKLSQDKFSVSRRRRHHSIATRDIRMNDVLRSSEIYANPLSPIGEVAIPEICAKSTTAFIYEDNNHMNTNYSHSCYTEPYYITMHMFGLGFGLVLGLGLLGIVSWLGLGLSLTAALLALLAVLVTQVHENKDKQRQHNGIKPIHSPESYRKDSCNEGFGSSNLDLHMPDTRRSNIISDIYVNGEQDTARSSTYGYDGTLNKIFDRREMRPHVVQDTMLLQSSQIPVAVQSVITTNENTYAREIKNEQHKLANDMKYTLNFSQESISLRIHNPEINPVESGVNVIEEGLQITYGRYKITVKEV